ncbi:MAG: 2-nitropropane dioxygenase, partial [Alphaproteobacteria bacterium]|nr:2-nitropropane dioxygenase [Alphaproteobacteria bacterium]
NGGGFGVMACGSMTPELLRAEIQGTRALTRQPFGVNLITMHPQLDELIGVCLEEKVGHIVLAGGVPSAPAIKKVKEGGAKLVCFAPALTLAKRLVRLGADALVIEGTEAGGHIGPVTTSVLAQEILPVLRDVPVFVAGGIGRGEMMLSWLERGAAGVQIGTLLVCARECVAHANFKKAFIRAASRDAVPSSQLDPRFPVIPVRALVNDGTRAFMDKQREVIARFDRGELTKEAAQLEIEHFWAGALRRAAIEGDVENGSVMAGQIVGLVTEEKPAATILADLIAQAEANLK